MKHINLLLLILSAFIISSCSSEELNEASEENDKLVYDQAARSKFMTVMAVDLDYAGMITENLEYTRASTVVQDREFAKLGEKIVVDLEPYTESFIYSYPDIKKSDVVDAANEEGIPVNELEVYIGMILTDPVFDEYKAATRSLGFWDVVGCIAIGESMQAWSTAGSKAIIKSIAKKAARKFAERCVPYVGTAVAVGSAASCIYDNW